MELASLERYPPSSAQKVTRDRSQRKLWISQTALLEDEDKDFNHMPAMLSSYQELAGCLLWVARCTRPDSSYAASYLS